MRSARSVRLALLILTLALALTASVAQAAPTISIQGYSTGGSFTPVSEGGSIPNGSTLKVRVWVDLYSCGSVRVGWGDGSPAETRDYGGSFSQDWTHTYRREGTYGIVATDCDGSDGASIRVGGAGASFSLGPLDPDSSTFIPALVSLVLGLIGLAMANARVPSAPAPPARPGLNRPSWWKPLQPGIPASHVQHIASLKDIPIGARRLPQPRIEMKPGEPTDVLEKQVCPRCGFPLGYTVAGWFCLNTKCPLIDADDATLFPDVGGHYGAPPLEAPRA